MSGEKRKTEWIWSIARWSIPVLLVLICLCFRFPRFFLQALAVLLCFPVSYVLFCSKRRLLKSRRMALAVCVLLLAFLCVYGAVVYGVHNARYQMHDLDRNVFKGKRILVMIPHQDDEINLFGGLYEIFGKESEIYVMFSTNGDKKASAETRFMEAVNALGQMGVDREHMIFLGYGDSCFGENGLHMYNLPGDEVFTSLPGYTRTYGTYGFAPYRDSAYTRNNMKNDIKALLLDLRPEAVFCLDYDSHHDHRALSLLFEEAMGEILGQEQNDYVPAVFKGFAYSTAYWGADDFYADNILSTVPWSEHYPYPGNAFTDHNGEHVIYMGENNIYRWNDRIRFPVAENNLSRTLRASNLYQAMHAHESQDFLYQAFERIPRIINGDKVFWIRPATGLLYGAEVSVSSGDGSVLKDFKLIDSLDIYDKTRAPFENLWAPEETDSDKTAAFAFGEEKTVDAICLYDNPSLTDNITRIRILFSDGSEMECGPLDMNGSGTWVQFDEKKIAGFTVQILAAEGETPGLSEVEAYHKFDPAAAVPEMIKLEDANGDFVYDYWLPEGEATFSVYHSREAFGADIPREYTLTAAGGKCAVEKKKDARTFRVSCKKGQSAELALYAEGKDEPVDRVTVRNPYGIERWWVRLLTEAEKKAALYSPAEQFAYFRRTILDYWNKLPFRR